MINRDSDAAAVRFPPPLVYLAAVLAGVLLQRIVTPLMLPTSWSFRITAAALTAVVGLVFLGGAAGLFRRSGQNPKPWKTTPEIVTNGVYRWSRNPMYVGMALVQAAIGFGFANAWIICLTPAALLLVYLIAVRHEEAYLEHKFGTTYRDYKSSVRRWL